MAISPISSSSQAAQQAFGLDFQSLLRIILTELTYQDPLKPMDNFQFVSQLGQFAQLQQSQTTNDRLDQLLANDGSTFAVGLLGKTVDVAQDDRGFSGVVRSISFAGGQTSLVIAAPDGQIFSDISLSNISQIR